MGQEVFSRKKPSPWRPDDKRFNGEKIRTNNEVGTPWMVIVVSPSASKRRERPTGEHVRRAALSVSRGTGGLTLDVGRPEGSGAWLEIKRRSPLGLQEPENWKFERRVAVTRERCVCCRQYSVKVDERPHGKGFLKRIYAMFS